MRLVKWEHLPDNMRNEKVRPYYDILRKKKGSLIAKRIFDVAGSTVLIIILSPLMAGIAICIKIDSNGPVMFRQSRVTQYGREFRIFKFRTMVENAEKIGSQVTHSNDSRITRVGSKIRKVRLDELPQLFNILTGDMTFVGTRPEVLKYVSHYTDEMMATFLLPAGVTSKASVWYKDEDEILACEENVDAVYVNKVLPNKMKLNLEGLQKFSCWDDFKTILLTIKAVI